MSSPIMSDQDISSLKDSHSFISLSIQVASELFIQVPSSILSTPPTLPTPTPLLPTDTIYTAPGNLLTYNLTIRDADSILGVGLTSVLPLPEGAWLGDLQLTGAYTGTLCTCCVTLFTCNLDREMFMYTLIINTLHSKFCVSCATICKLCTQVLSLVPSPHLGTRLTGSIIYCLHIIIFSLYCTNTTILTLNNLHCIVCCAYKPSPFQPLTPLITHSHPPHHTLSAMVPFNWQPSAAQVGEHVVCFLARDRLSTLSPPLCLVVVVEDGMTEVR